jgi:hypothetical protein
MQKTSRRAQALLRLMGLMCLARPVFIDRLQP